MGGCRQATVFPGADPDELDLIQRMLTWDPEQRITALESLRHPFLAEFESPDETSIKAFDFDSAEDLRRQMKSIESAKGAHQPPLE
jgi:serine/threonine protein kinase